MALIYERNYSKMKKLGILDSVSAENPSANFVADDFTDLCVEYLGIRKVKNGNSVPIISLTHYSEEDEDLISDPNMEVAVYHDMKMVEALTFLNAYIYQEVYNEPDVINVSLKDDLNQLLEDWLDNTKAQGHRLVMKEVAH